MFSVNAAKNSKTPVNELRTVPAGALTSMKQMILVKGQP